MHLAAAEKLIESVRRREQQGDHPTEPALSVETLEDLVLTLAEQSANAEASGIRAFAEWLGQHHLWRYETDAEHFIAHRATQSARFTRDDLEALRLALDPSFDLEGSYGAWADSIRSLAARIAALLPPDGAL